MHVGDLVLAQQTVGGVVTVVPHGTRGIIVSERPIAGRYEVQFENGRTVTCREGELLLSRSATTT